MFLDTLNLLRSEHIFYDYRALWGDIGSAIETESTKAYVEHLDTIRGEENEKLYVTYMLDI